MTPPRPVVRRVGGPSAEASGGIAKRRNPVGVASDPEIVRAYRNAFRAAPVAAGAGAGKAPIYRRWQSKEELLLAARSSMKAPGFCTLKTSGFGWARWRSTGRC